ncbi:MDR family MFS transporter [Nocardiopsis trehalosi]|uniref:MDR family MFS transporter n=1 Tax=Nocardiopsis trehalosi TaxID=109329 RepID=UPI00082BE8D3|nr:MDR family MFS transporter [Nocardiopsis trehalosi]
MARHAAGRDEPHVLVIIGALLLAVLVAALNQTVVSTAMPRIASELGGLSHISWVVTSYLLAVTATTPLWGKLGDQFGRKWVLLTCLVLFLAGSALCGTASTFGTLIAYRAVQGIGGGGLMVLAQAVIGDVVPPRDRGRYQGLFGAVFGVASVAGPLIGGFIVDNLSWRWVFYVNVPLGVIAFATLLLVLPRTSGRDRQTVDYAGITLIAAASVCLVLVTSWGGTTYDWVSPQIAALAGAAVVLAALWWVSARRAADPVLPLTLFRNRVIVVGMLVSFAVGFAMMGAMAYLPLFLQIVHGYSATASGLHMLPMVLGMLLCSIGSGQLVSRTGHYKAYPIVGTALVTVALLLLSTLDPDTPFAVMSVYFFLLGSGLGLTMQVVVVVVQNAADYRDLGAATSAATFFRSIGGSVGTSIFGAVFAGHLSADIAARADGLDLPPGVRPEQLQNNPGLLDRLPPEAARAFLESYSGAVDTVFLAATPVAAAGFVFALFLKQIPLRTTIGSDDLDASIAPVPASRATLAMVERSIYRLFGHEGALHVYTRLSAAAGVDLSPAACWVATHLAVSGPIPGDRLAELARVPEERLDPVHGELMRTGMLTGGPGDWTLTAAGTDVARRLFDAQEAALRALMRDYSPERHPDLVALLHRLSKETLGDDHDAALLAGPADGRTR